MNSQHSQKQVNKCNYKIDTPPNDISYGKPNLWILSLCLTPVQSALHKFCNFHSPPYILTVGMLCSASHSFLKNKVIFSKKGNTLTGITWYDSVPCGKQNWVLFYLVLLNIHCMGTKYCTCTL